VAERLSRVGLRVFVIYLRPHHGLPGPHEAGDAIEFRILEWDELFRHANDPELDLDESFLHAAKERGDLCVGAFDGQRLVAYIWRAFGPTPAEDGLWVRFRRPYRYGYKSLTRPEYRGRHIQSAMAPTTDAVLLERGYTHAIGYVALHNLSSRRSALRHGNRAIGYAGYVRALGRAWTFESPGAKRHGFAFFDPGREPPPIHGAPTGGPPQPA
jgi:hypothetical protein